MIEEHLGDTIDIHGGGRDLIFPHHENEIAQSQCAHDGKQYVKYWMHNAFMTVNGEKMAKSKGNFFTVRELLEEHPGEVIRFSLLSAKYREDLDFSDKLMTQAKQALDSLYGALKNSEVEAVEFSKADLSQSAGYQALLDDLNTPLAISELHRLAKELNKDASNAQVKGELIAVAGVMGLLQSDPNEWFQGGSDEDAAWIEDMIEQRQQAKLDKNWGRADEIREELKAKGIVLLDSKEGTTWRKE